MLVATTTAQPQIRTKRIETLGDLLEELKDYPSNMRIKSHDRESGFNSIILKVKQDQCDTSSLLLVCDMEP